MALSLQHDTVEFIPQREFNVRGPSPVTLVRFDFAVGTRSWADGPFCDNVDLH